MPTEKAKDEEFRLEVDWGVLTIKLDITIHFSETLLPAVQDVLKIGIRRNDYEYHEFLSKNS